MSKHSIEPVNSAEARVEFAPRPEIAEPTPDRKVTSIEEQKRKNHALHQLGRFSMEGLISATTGERYPYAHIETGMKRSFIGQDEAIETFVRVLNRGELRDENCPYGIVLLLGPSGVGKTAMANRLAELLHGDAQSGMLTVDGGSHSHGHEITSLVGAPPSYIGYDQTPLFASDVLTKDKNIFLVDEVEKSALPLQNLLLEITEKGTVNLQNQPKKTDGVERRQTASFKDSIIVMTSNIAAEEIMQIIDPKQIGFQPSSQNVQATKERIKSAAMGALKAQLKPELINRIGDVVVCMNLDDEQLKQALNIHIEQANQRYLNRYGIMLNMSKELRDKLVMSTENRQQLGIRQVKHMYARTVESKLSECVSTGGIPKGSRVFALSGAESEVSSGEALSVELYYEQSKDLLDGYMAAEAVRELARREAAAAEAKSKEVVVLTPPLGDNPSPDPTPSDIPPESKE